MADSPRIFETLGITGTSTKLFATGFYGIAKTLGMVIFSVWLVERVGRRNGLIYGAFIGSIPMWYIGGYVLRADPAGAAAAGTINQTGWGYLAMVCVYLYGLIYCATWQGITWVYCSEIFPIGKYLLPPISATGQLLNDGQISACSALLSPPPTSGSGRSLSHGRPLS
jgi:hypothetical protein